MDGGRSMRAVKSSEGPRFGEGLEETGHNKTALVLVRRAQLRIDQATLENEMGNSKKGAGKDLSAPIPLKENERAWREH